MKDPVPDPVESGTYDGQFTFKYVQAEDVEPVLEHLMDVLLRCFDIYGYDRKTMEWEWRDLFKSLLEESLGMSFYVVDNNTGKTAGARVLVLKNRSDPEHPIEWKHPKNKDIFEYFMGLAEKCNVFEEYPTADTFAEMFGISVNPEYRQRGIAKEIYRRALAMLKQRGVTVARCGFTSPWSRRAAKSFGCKIFAVEKVCEARLPDGRYLNPDADPEAISDYGMFEL